jgi:hypothetical protein
MATNRQPSHLNTCLALQDCLPEIKLDIDVAYSERSQMVEFSNDYIVRAREKIKQIEATLNPEAVETAEKISDDFKQHYLKNYPSQDM